MTNIVATTRDDLWKLIRHYGRFTLSDLHRHSDMHKSSVKLYLRILQKGGFVTASNPAAGKPIIYNLIKDCGVCPPELTITGKPKKPSAQQRMWSAMKVMKQFDFRDLAMTAQVTSYAAHGYCRHLCNAKYIRLIVQGQAPRTPNLYVFVKSRDTGPLAPRIRSDESVYDRNQCRIVWPEGEVA